MTDRRTIEVARILYATRAALGLAPDTRACVLQAFSGTDVDLARLRDAIGDLIAADKQRTRRRGTRRARRFGKRA